MATRRSTLIYHFFGDNQVPFQLLWGKHLGRYLQVPKYYEHDCKFQKWHSWIIGLLILIKYISFQLLFNRIQRSVSKNNSKKTKKTRKWSDFKLECTKTFLIKFCWHGSIFRQKFQVFLEHALREDDKNTSVTPFRYLNGKGWEALGIA